MESFKKVIIFGVVFGLLGVAGKFGGEFLDRQFQNEKDKKINQLSDQYAEASKKATAKLRKFVNAESKEIKTAEQVNEIRNLLIECEKAFRHYEKIRKEALKYLKQNKGAFEEKEFEKMVSAFGNKYLVNYSNAVLKFISSYKNTLAYAHKNFNEIVAGEQPESNIYEKKWQRSEKLRNQVDIAYKEKVERVKEVYGEEMYKRAKKELSEDNIKE